MILFCKDWGTSSQLVKRGLLKLEENKFSHSIYQRQLIPLFIFIFHPNLVLTLFFLLLHRSRFTIEPQKGGWYYIPACGIGLGDHKYFQSTEWNNFHSWKLTEGLNVCDSTVFMIKNECVQEMVRKYGLSMCLRPIQGKILFRDYQSTPVCLFRFLFLASLWVC